MREPSGVSDLRLHALRTTVRTRLSELGVAPDVGERILGHTMGKIRSVYDKHDYVPQMRAAMETWARTLAALMTSQEREGADVVPIRRSADRGAGQNDVSRRRSGRGRGEVLPDEVCRVGALRGPELLRPPDVDVGGVEVAFAVGAELVHAPESSGERSEGPP